MDWILTLHVHRGNIELTEEVIQAFQEADITLCGGLFSGNDVSFRGKVYVMLVLEIAEENLTQMWIPPEIVQKCTHHCWRATRKKPFANMTYVTR